MSKMPLLLVPILLLSACTGQSTPEPSRCAVPPIGFSEENVVGTWVAEEPTDPSAIDTLTFKEDGTYRQVIHIERPAYDFESQWQAWRLEVPDIGPPYLYMKGMRLHAYFPDLIERDVVGGGDGYWFDFCKGTGIKMPAQEGVLIVYGAGLLDEPSGVVLRPPQIPDMSGWYYKLVDQ